MVAIMYIVAVVFVVRGFRYGLNSFLDVIFFAPSMYLITHILTAMLLQVIQK